MNSFTRNAVLAKLAERGGVDFRIFSPYDKRIVTLVRAQTDDGRNVYMNLNGYRSHITLQVL